jgi:hypothetical protein
VQNALDAASPIPTAPSGTTPSRRSPWLLWAFAVLWVLVVVGGLSVLWAYENTPGDPGSSPAQWPSDTTLSRAADQPTLVLFAHPQCTCTRASLGELAETLARADRKPKTYVVFLKPLGFAEGWEQTDLWRTATSLPNVTVVRDDEGTEAERFGAVISGQTVLYDDAGTLIFSGGITGARGHAGDNAGRASLVALLNRGRPQRSWTSVFGCRLFTSTS